MDGTASNYLIGVGSPSVLSQTQFHTYGLGMPFPLSNYEASRSFHLSQASTNKKPWGWDELGEHFLSGPHILR